MPSPAPEALALAGAYRLGLHDRNRRGPAGERLGKAAGASLEFQDRRAYVPGDDVRHLDWAAYARTDQLMVRLYREEVAPRVEVLLDDSASMALDARKAALAVDLAALFVRAAGAGGFHPRLILLGDRPEHVEERRFLAEGAGFVGRSTLPESLQAAGGLLRPGALRVVVSDFLFPHDPAGLVRPLGGEAGGLALVQVLSREDAEPLAGEALRLVDAERGEHIDLVLDARTLARYRERLERLNAGLTEEARRASGTFAQVVARDDAPLDRLCRDVLVPCGVLVPA
jgi:hypothetical protein